MRKAREFRYTIVISSKPFLPIFYSKEVYFYSVFHYAPKNIYRPIKIKFICVIRVKITLVLGCLGCAC